MGYNRDISRGLHGVYRHDKLSSLLIELETIARDKKNQQRAADAATPPDLHGGTDLDRRVPEVLLPL